MTLLLGSKERCALEIGERAEGLRRVDAWMAGQWLTCDDNLAYVPSFGGASSATGSGWSQPKSRRLPSPGCPLRQFTGSYSPAMTGCGNSGASLSGDPRQTTCSRTCSARAATW